MLVIIQLDSVNVALVQRLLDEGRMPAVAGLRERGLWRRLEAPSAHLAAGAYHTLYSGLEVGEHGLYHTFQWSAKEQRLHFKSEFPKPETVWERVSRARRRCLIIDPYLSWPPTAVEGLCVSGWQLNNRIILQSWSAPAAAYARLTRRFGPSLRIEETLGTTTVHRLLALRDRLAAAPARAAELVEYLAAREALDLVWVTFAPAHFASHWLMDPMSLVNDHVSTDERHALEGALASVYEAVDAAIARTLQALPDSADVILLSPTAIAANTSRSELLPGMLQSVLGARAPRGRLWQARAMVPASWREAFSRVAPGAVNRELVARMYLLGTDWRRTRAFVLPGETAGLLRLNLRGREREGIVDDAQGLLEEISEGLATFCDPDGALAVDGVDRSQDDFAGGRCTDLLPDLTVRWSSRPSKECTFVSSPKFGVVARNGIGTGWSGNHCDEAWALVVPGLSNHRTPGRPAAVVDIAATVCDRLDADSSGLAGQSLLQDENAAGLQSEVGAM